MAFSLFSILPAVTAGGAILTNIQVTLTGTPSTSATVGVPYSFTPVAASGSGTKTFALTGVLLGGLVFDTTTGSITGTPTVTGTMSGLNITVTDLSGSATLGSFSISVITVTPGTTTLMSVVPYRNASITLHKPYQVGFFAPVNAAGDGEPYIVNNTGEAPQIIDTFPRGTTVPTGTFSWNGNPAYSDPACPAHGAMIDPWTTASQSFDGLYGYRDLAVKTLTDTVMAYDSGGQADPGLTGSPTVIPANSAHCFVKSIRKDGVYTTGVDVIAEDFVFFHFVPAPPPAGAIAPHPSAINKTDYFTTADINKSALGDGFSVIDPNTPAYNLKTLEECESFGSFDRPNWPFFGQNVGTRKRMMNARSGNYSGTYGSDWVDFSLAMLAKGQACPDWAINRILQFAQTWLAWIEHGNFGGAGAGQWAASKWSFMLLLHCFPNKPGLWDKVVNFKGNATHQTFWMTSDFVGFNVQFPGGHSVNHGTFQEPLVGKPYWVSSYSGAPSPRSDFDGNPNADYEFVSGKVTFGELLAIALLKNGPNGWEGIHTVSQSLTIGSSVRLSSCMAYMDRYRTYLVDNNTNYASDPVAGKFRRAYDRLRAGIGHARWEDVPEKFNIDDPDKTSAYLAAGTNSGVANSLTNTPVGTFSWDLTKANHSWPLAQGAHVEYSFDSDRVTWKRCPTTGLAGTSPALPPGAYAIRWRMFNAKGLGAWSHNYPRAATTGAVDAMIITVGGTAATTQVVSVDPPTVCQLQYPKSQEKMWVPSPATIDVTQITSLYAGRGFQTGAISAAATIQWYRNNLSTPLAADPSDPRKYNLTAADAGQNLFFTMVVGSGGTAATLTSNTVAISAAPARQAGYIIDQQIDGTFPIFYPAVFQSAKDNLLNTSSISLEPNFIQTILVDPNDPDSDSIELTRGLMRGVKSNAQPRLRMNLAADVPVTPGKYYRVQMTVLVGSSYKVWSGRPVVRLGSTLSGLDYYYSETPGPAFSQDPQPRLLSLDITTKIPIVAGTSALWWEVQVAFTGGSTGGGDPQITGSILVTEVP